MLVKNGLREMGKGPRRKRRKGGKEGGNKQGYVTTAHNLVQKYSPHMPKTALSRNGDASAT